MRILVFILCLITSLPSLYSQDKATANLEFSEIKLGDQTTLTLSLEFDVASDSIMFPELKDSISKFVQLVDLSKIDTTFDEDDIGKKILSQQLTITSWDTGYHAIAPFRFVIGKDTIETSPLMLHVLPVNIEAEQDIKDIKEIEEVPFSLWDWILSNRKVIGLVCLLILCFVLAIFIYRRYFKNREENKLELKPIEPAHLIAFRKLEELANKKLWQNKEVKTYHSELTFILREYLENQYSLPSLELTSDETIALIKANLNTDKESIAKLSYVFEIADMAKFAKQEPLASENESAFEYVKHFVEVSQQIEAAKTEEIIVENE